LINDELIGGAMSAQLQLFFPGVGSHCRYDGWIDGRMVCHAARQGDGGLDGSNIFILPWLCCSNVIVIPVFKQATATFYKVNELGTAGAAGTASNADAAPNDRELKLPILESQECTRDQFLHRR
jgi:hypothetical protein